MTKKQRKTKKEIKSDDDLINMGCFSCSIFRKKTRSSKNIKSKKIKLDEANSFEIPNNVPVKNSIVKDNNDSTEHQIPAGSGNLKNVLDLIGEDTNAGTKLKIHADTAKMDNNKETMLGLQQNVKIISSEEKNITEHKIILRKEYFNNPPNYDISVYVSNLQAQEQKENYKKDDSDSTNNNFEESSRYKERKLENRHIGLQNLGNTCYANSLFQILCRTKIFKDAINNEINSEQNAFKSSLKEIINYFDGRKVCIDNSIKTLIKSLEFEMGHQNDSAEFLSKLLKELTKVCPTIIEAFYGKKENYIREYSDNQNSYTTNENFLIISFQEFYSLINDGIEEEIEGYGTIKTTIIQFPKILVLQNFQYGLKSKKIRIKTALEINDKKRQFEKILFKLYGIIVHYGTMHGGHYICYYRENTNQDSWRKYDDSSVSSVIKFKQINENPFLLFYQRKISSTNVK